MTVAKEVNTVSMAAVGNSIRITEPRNRVEASVFSVTSTYYLLTQFQPYRHDRRVGDDT